jgi:hypothetical protein
MEPRGDPILISAAAPQLKKHLTAKNTARLRRNQIEKQGFTTENAEFAEIFVSKSLSLSPPRLRGEFSI